jgi:hypothetical protein
MPGMLLMFSIRSNQQNSHALTQNLLVLCGAYSWYLIYVFNPLKIPEFICFTARYFEFRFCALITLTYLIPQ